MEIYIIQLMLYCTMVLLNMYNPKNDWILSDSDYLSNHKTTRFVFLSIESKIINKCNTRLGMEIHAKTEEEAWSRLKSPMWGMQVSLD